MIKKQSNMNRLANVHNPYQGVFKKVLCVCSAGLLRSPSAALVLSQKPFNFNTRSAGLSNEYALIVVDDVLLKWADAVVVMNKIQELKIKKRTTKPVFCLDIPDNFEYRDPSLMRLIKKKCLCNGILNQQEIKNGIKSGH